MSKVIAEFITKVSGTASLLKKFKGAHTPGQRIVPTKTAKNDELYQLRIDAGEVPKGTHMQNIVLQVNTQAKNTALKNWVKKHTTHGKLATTSFDTKAADVDKEVIRALGVLEKAAKENISK